MPLLSQWIKKEATFDNKSCFFFVARLKGLEPLTYWFVASHSIQLSYKRIWDEKDYLFHRRKVYYHIFLEKSREIFNQKV